jgi:hypothetical protein
MKELDLIDAFNYLRLCEGVILEGRLIEISLIGIENESDNEFAYLFWSEDVRGEFVDFEVVFKEGDNEFVVIDGPYMTLINSDGEEEELLLLRSWDTEHDRGTL